jgi:crotonobetainyl-CoA:carnitine CoA-transferase CaiB-like acyl-CoA transferase
MPAVLDDLVVVEVGSSMVGSLAAMLLGDYGARVCKVERPGAGSETPSDPGPLVWDRNKARIELDLTTEGGRASLRELAAGADVLIETFAPGQAARLGVDLAAFRAAQPRLITCSVTGYGASGEWADRPGWDALVQARSGLAGEQPAWLRDGPTFLHTPLPTYGAFYLASCGINAALRAREVTGLGQHVATSLMQGAVLWTTMIWTRAERPTPDLTTVFKYRDLMPTPTYGAADGWFHPMPQAIGVGKAHFGVEDPDLDPALGLGDHDSRRRYQDAVERMFRSHPKDEWLELLWAAEVPAQPALPPGECHTHPQVVHNRVVTQAEVPGHGRLAQLGHPYHLQLDEERDPVPPVRIEEPAELFAARGPAGAPTASSAGGAPDRAPARPLDRALSGVRVLDYGVALAGPFGPMVMADLGADVIKIDTVSPAVGTSGGFLWAACQRSKRSIAINLKSPEGQQISHKLIASADVLHYNMRVGVAERLGFGYQQARAVNPSIVYCHLTGYGNTGPLASWPGVDQMGQALAGIEWEQGGGFDGGDPQWSRFGMCDAAAGLLSVIGVLQALYHRERTGEGQQVETNILNAGMVFASDVLSGGAGLPDRAHLDRLQTGFGPLHRFYETAEGWLCIVVSTEAEWHALTGAIGRPELDQDPRFADPSARQGHSAELADELGRALGAKSARDWFAALDAAGVPCEVVRQSPDDDRSSGGSAPTWFADPDAQRNRWVVANDHPVWGRLEQPGGLVELSATPGRAPGAAPIIGEHTREVLLELGYAADEIDDLRARGIVAW